MAEVNPDTMSEAEYKVFENRLRRVAQRQGLILMKSRRRDPRAIDYAGYMLVDGNNCAVAGSHPWEFSLDLPQVAAYLNET